MIEMLVDGDDDNTEMRHTKRKNKSNTLLS